MKYTNYYSQGCCQDLNHHFTPPTPHFFPPCPPKQPDTCCTQNCNELFMFMAGYLLGIGQKER